MKLAALALALGVAAVTAAGGVLLERYRYYDYSEAYCPNERYAIRANLVGLFNKDRPSERSSPYSVRIEVKMKAGDEPIPGTLAVKGLKLATSNIANTIDVLGLSKHAPDLNRVVYLSQPLPLLFDDYELKGFLASDDKRPEEISGFNCKIRRNFQSEWRVPFWDRFLSV